MKLSDRYPTPIVTKCEKYRVVFYPASRPSQIQVSGNAFRMVVTGFSGDRGSDVPDVGWGGGAPARPACPGCPAGAGAFSAPTGLA